MRRFWLVLIVLTTLGGTLWLAGPHLWAWYHLHAAETSLENYHADEALEHLNACLEVWPASAHAHLLVCRAARRTGNIALAEKHLVECQRLEGEPSCESAFEEDLFRAATGNLDGAEARLESRLEKNPAQAPLISEALVEGYLRTYRIRDALTCVSRWLEHQPNNVQALFLQANVWRQVRSHGKAVPNYRRVVKLDPGRYDARRWLAFCLMEDGQFDEAITHLDALRDRRPDDPDLLARLARCQSKRGQLDAARLTLTDLLAKHPDHGLALRVRGQLALMEKEPAEAETWLRQAIRVWPYDYESHYALYLALSHQGKKAAQQAQAKVTEDIKKRQERLGEIKSHDMSVRPRDPALHCELGTLLIGVGHAEVGRGWLDSALRLDPDYAAAHAALADYYAAHGQMEKAAEHRQKARSAASAPSQGP
jgi:tetratricopeptide (TPR) repeat protein